MSRRIPTLALTLTLLGAGALQAQITVPRVLSTQVDRYATLEEQLVNLLRATREDQRDYIAFVVKKVRKGKLEARLVVGIERYAIRRNPHYPFPFFERALHFEAGKRGVPLPSVQAFASTKNVSQP